jgi:plastocyanin
VAVPAGTTVTWVNRDMTVDTATHKRFSDEPFDSGDINATSTFSHAFRTPGTYSYLCTLHQGMTGTVAVEQTARKQ